MGLDLLTLASYNSKNKQMENRMAKCAMTLIGVREHEQYNFDKRGKTV